LKAILRKREEIAEGTLGCWFEPEAPLSFTAGQFGDLRSRTRPIPMKEATADPSPSPTRLGKAPFWWRRE